MSRRAPPRSLPPPQVPVPFRGSLTSQAVFPAPAIRFRYTTLRHGDTWLAGIKDASSVLPEGPARPHWSVYFGTDDTDATLARPSSSAAPWSAEDTPYGRIAAVADPTVGSSTFNSSADCNDAERATFLRRFLR